MDDRLAVIAGDDYPAGLPERAADVVRSGEVFLHPTETVHGYGCRWDEPAGVRRIEGLKGRPAEGKPMILLVPSPGWIDILAREVPPEARRVAERFWPGGVSLVLRASDEFRRRSAWTADTVAVRLCAHPFTARVLELADIPLVSTSIGLTGAPLPADSEKFARELYDRANGTDAPPPELSVVDRLLDQSPRAASTLVDFSRGEGIGLLRAGAVDPGRIERECGITLRGDPPDSI